jgi:hypothetical protein
MAKSHSKQDAENLVREAAAKYIQAQTPNNQTALREAVWVLGEFNPPQEEWVGFAPSHRFMLSLMPEHLRWPDPLCGDTLVSCGSVPDILTRLTDLK